ncbi:MAG TPA: DNA recombination protein RmuC [Bacteroidales bacterium]|nr:DNA recombination protein RmuC [Bacteroidales bacterium]
MEMVFLAIGLVAGAVIGWLFIRQKAFQERGISVEEVNNRYIAIDLFNQEKKENSDKENTIIALNARVAELSANLKNIEEKFTESKKEIEEIHKKFSLEFKNLSNDILEEKSKKFLELNEKSVGNLLNPLKEKIKEFEGKIDEVYKDETRERISLKKELENIVKLNQQVSDDAHKLTNALKGDKKMLGDWGEVQLEMILEKAGLERDIHYRKQESIRDEEGKNLRPDYIINLPDEKQLIVDSKVSLVAYERYFNSDDDNVKASALKQHLNDLLNHIRELGDKNYQKLYGINPPDYVLMFVPIEPAMALAQREDPSLFDKALKKNIVMVGTSTLLATLRTINFIWNQDKQRKNVFEIARQSGALYEKFTGFIEDLLAVGRKLDDAKSEYSNAMNKLYESKKKGDTIIGRIQRIKELGAETTKSLPQNILDKLEE